MALPERAQVVDMVDYLRETLAEIDAASTWLAGRRQQFALRLAALEAATDPEVLAAASDYEQRQAEARPYEGAESAVALFSDAHRRFCDQP